MKINNVPASAEKFMVVRRIDNELWFWGSWENRDTANEVALQIGGEVVENDK